MSEELTKKLAESEEAVTVLLREMTKLSRQGEYAELSRKLELLVMRLEFIDIIKRA